MPAKRGKAINELKCDSCQFANAQVEVLIGGKPVFLCGHHFQKHRAYIERHGYMLITLTEQKDVANVPRG